METFDKIQTRLREDKKAPARKDLNQDFPLRGFVLCECGKPLTACWSKSKTGKKHPYYLCFNKSCEHHRKSIPRDKIEGEFETMLKTLQPSEKLLAVAKVMFKEAWSQRLVQAKHGMVRLKNGIKKADKQIDQLLNRVVETDNATLITAYEKKIATLEKQKLISAEKLQKKGNPRYTFDKMFELAVQFLANPCNLWGSGQLHLRRIVLRLAFSKRISYHRNQGLRTPQVSEPLRFFGNFLGENKMAHHLFFERD